MGSAAAKMARRRRLPRMRSGEKLNSVRSEPWSRPDLRRTNRAIYRRVVIVTTGSGSASSPRRLGAWVIWHRLQPVFTVQASLGVVVIRIAMYRVIAVVVLGQVPICPADETARLAAIDKLRRLSALGNVAAWHLPAIGTCCRRACPARGNRSVLGPVFPTALCCSCPHLRRGLFTPRTALSTAISRRRSVHVRRFSGRRI